MILRNVLLLIVFVEVVAGGWFLWRRADRTTIELPSVSLMDSVMAGELFQLAQRAAEGSSSDWQELAQALLAYGYYGHAETCFQRALELDARNRSAEFGVAFCQDRTGRTQQSIAAYRRLLERADADMRTQCWYAIGRCFLREENAADAEVALEQIRSFPAAAYHLALLRLRRQRPGDSLPIINEQLRTFPRSVKFLTLKRKAELQLADYPMADTTANAIDRSEYVVDTSYNRAFVEQFAFRYGLAREISNYNEALNSQQLPQAESLLDNLLQTLSRQPAPEAYLIWDAAIRRAFQQGNLPLAQQRLDRVKASGVYLPSLAMLEGDLAWAQGDSDTAVKSWSRAANQSPAMEIFERLARAAEVRQDGVAEDAHRSRILRQQGREAFENDQLPEALGALEQSLRLHPTASAYYLLGEVHRQAGRRPAAVEAYSECVMLQPNHGRALDQLARLQTEFTDAAP